jgi:hypothetical protein
MKHKVLVGTIMVLLLAAFHGQLAYTADYEADFAKAIAKNDLSKMEKILQKRANKMDLTVCMTTVVLEDIRGFNMRNSPNVIDLLLRYGADINKASGRGYATFKNKIGSARVGEAWNFGIPLLFAAGNGNFELVKFLVEKGAKINLRDSRGATAASIAYDKGELEIYNYLKEQGATDFEPLAVRPQASPSPAPSSSGSSAPSGSSPSSSAAADLANAFNQAFSSPLQDGTYGLSGTDVKVRFMGIGKSGQMTYTNNQGRISTGSYSINGNTITIQAEGKTFAYTITSSTMFSGMGETWVRTGY